MKEKTKNYKRGFTLLELLVVVLIIGILAGIALPQYNKAVMKAKLAQVDITINALKKNIQLYLYDNGFPGNTVYFTSSNRAADIEIFNDRDCDTWRCNIDLGFISSYCGDFCIIQVDLMESSYGGFALAISPEKPNWSLIDVYPSTLGSQKLRVLCEYLKNMNIPADTTLTYDPSVCSTVGISLKEI